MTRKYRPMRLADLATHLIAEPDEKIRWRVVSEFLEEYGWEQPEVQIGLLMDEPTSVSDERWDALLAALAEHFAAEHGLAPPDWAEPRKLRKAWFPAELVIQRMDALIWAPAAFCKHGVFLSVHDLARA